MKLDDFIYAVAEKVFYELEHTHHFQVPEEYRGKIIEKIKSQSSDLIK